MSINTPVSQDRVAVHAMSGAASILADYASIRATTLRLVESLSAEDCAIQAMPEASPAKWHLAHSTWFFEAFVLAPNIVDYTPISETYLYLFNSYYNAMGRQFHRPHRGLLSRPSLDEVLDYRRAVDDRMTAFIESASDDVVRRVAPTIETGLNHEQQHQELILTDIKALFSANPLRPVYRAAPASSTQHAQNAAGDVRWIQFREGLREIGSTGDRFCYDNETPRHRIWVDAFALAERPVSNGEFAAFIADGGYERPEIWLSDGWNAVQRNAWTQPLYWEKSDGVWSQLTLAGMRRIDASEPVCHLSYYEADAFARWSGARLPTEAEWEIAAAASIAEGHQSLRGTLLEDERFHPAPCPAGVEGGVRLQRMIGDVWEWTSSAYAPYPGYQSPEGALGEYNAKFMCNQLVLRGGSCATPQSHIRETYRNYFAAEARWQFSGLRLARNG
ncbi:MAG: ergothioneine biosynthesis protein EgtB [Phycisphaerales bacterium]|nr:ergothioneine biosynthesis protein EgtB [Phycisphaerales bacterium]